MVQSATKGKKDVRSVIAEQGCSNTELRTVGNRNKLVYLTSQITTRLYAAPSLISHFIKILIVSHGQNSPSHTSTPGVSRNFSKELISIVARFLELNIT